MLMTGMIAKILIILAGIQVGIVIGCSSSIMRTESPVPIVSAVAPVDVTPTPSETRTDCPNPETGWKIEKLNGNVKSIRNEEIEYGYGSRAKEVTRIVTFKPNGDYIKIDERQFYRVEDHRKIPKPTFVFDKDCRVLERRTPKNPTREAGATRTVYSYTQSGILKEEATYDPQNRLLWKSVLTLDDKDKVIEENQTIQEHPEHFRPKRYDVYRHTKALYKNDAAGNMIEEISYKYDGTLYATYRQSYDSANRLIRKLRLDHKNRPITLAIYKFDDSGILQEELKYSSSTYSSVDDLIPGTLDSDFGMFQDGNRIVYAYDQKSNWIKKSEYDLSKAGKLQHLTFRIIVYY